MARIKANGTIEEFATGHKIDPILVDISEEGQPSDIREADFCVDTKNGAATVHTPVTRGQFYRSWTPVTHGDAQELTTVG